ncbi:MAG: hypothetical protein QOF68_2484 [Gaiellales bacterium]|jgi:hypothetical protein|nr:hypothetical protein [Gaiellales bacterium]
MSHDFRIDDRQKAFGDLTAADLEQIRDHPDRGFPIESYRLDELVEDMRRGGAAKVDDLGREAAERWARLIGVIPKF